MTYEESEQKLLDGNKISLRRAERKDVPLLAEWINDPEFIGEFSDFPTQVTQTQLEKRMFDPQLPQMEWVDFIVQKKDEGEDIGWAVHYVCSQNFGWNEIGFYLIPGERLKGYGTEASKILVDYLFMTKDIPRVQAITSVNNKVSQRALEKSGFKKEGTLRKALWTTLGKWTNGYLYSILREEWKNPKILTTKTHRS